MQEGSKNYLYSEYRERCKTKLLLEQRGRKDTQDVSTSLSP